MQLGDKVEPMESFLKKKLLFLLDPEAPINIHSPTEDKPYGVVYAFLQGYPRTLK